MGELRSVEDDDFLAGENAVGRIALGSPAKWAYLRILSLGKVNRLDLEYWAQLRRFVRVTDLGLRHERTGHYYDRRAQHDAFTVATEDRCDETTLGRWLLDLMDVE